MPGIQDESGGIERCVRDVLFAKKAVKVPVGPYQIHLDNTLLKKLYSKAYGACFLGQLIEIFQQHGHDFETPESVLLASKDYIDKNQVLNQFLAEAYDRTGDNRDKVPLKHIWELLTSSPMRAYYDQLGMKMSRELGKKMKRMEFEVTKVHGASFVCGLKGKNICINETQDDDEVDV
jgi:hypothetical protein